MGLLEHLPDPWGGLGWPVLFSHGHCEFTSAVVLSYPTRNALLQTSSIPGPCRFFFTPSYVMIPDPLGRACDTRSELGFPQFPVLCMLTQGGSLY